MHFICFHQPSSAILLFQSCSCLSTLVLFDGQLVQNPFIPRFLSTNVISITNKKSVSTIDMYDSVKKLYDLLHTKKIHAVPVIENGLCVGVIGGHDIAQYYLKKQASCINFTTAQLQQDSVVQILTNSELFLPLFEDTSLLDAISMIAPGANRAVVLKSVSEHTISAMCSETDILRTIYESLSAEKPAEVFTKISTLSIQCFFAYSSAVDHVLDDSEPIAAVLNKFQDILKQPPAKSAAPPVVNQTETSSTQASTNVSPLEWVAPLVLITSPGADGSTSPIIKSFFSMSSLHPNTSILDDTVHNDDQTTSAEMNTSTATTTTVTTHLDHTSNQITIAQYRQKFPASLGYVTGTTSTLFEIIRFLLDAKQDYVWIKRGDIPSNLQRYNFDDKTTASTNAASFYVLDAIPYEWHANRQLAIVSQSDILRLFSRDNVWLSRQMLIDHLVTEQKRANKSS